MKDHMRYPGLTSGCNRLPVPLSYLFPFPFYFTREPSGKGKQIRKKEELVIGWCLILRAAKPEMD